MKLVTALNRRIRCTDEVGLLRGNRIGVVLPFTSIDGARRLAEEVRRGLPVVDSELRHFVYTYPSYWWSQDTHTGDTDGWGSGSDSGSTCAEIDESPVDIRLSGSNGSGYAANSRQDVCPKPEERIERLMAGPIPVWKRGLDIVGSLAALLLLSPLLLLAILVIKLTSGGPVLFRQERVGYLGNRFHMLKFRTMSVNADVSVHKQLVKGLIRSRKDSRKDQVMTKLDDRDSQIIPSGRLLRKTCIDELPQLINVLRGEMSLVGPRPCLSYEAEEYRLWNTERFNTIPGMTGLWQVKGKNALTFEEMIRLDITYARKRSFLLDLKILLLTFPVILSQMNRVRSKAGKGIANIKGEKLCSMLEQ
jgi:lipopolysaccharide/colanic/teichoic acid biosynthesis glycosyltransferase